MVIHFVSTLDGIKKYYKEIGAKKQIHPMSITIASTVN
jgi:hypothetical protein